MRYPNQGLPRSLELVSFLRGSTFLLPSSKNVFMHSSAGQPGRETAPAMLKEPLEPPPPGSEHHLRNYSFPVTCFCPRPSAATTLRFSPACLAKAWLSALPPFHPCCAPCFPYVARRCASCAEEQIDLSFATK